MKPQTVFFVLVLSVFVSGAAVSLDFGAPSMVTLVQSIPQEIVAGDFDGDGHLDFAVQHYIPPGAGDDMTVGILIGDGAGGFADDFAFGTSGMTTDLVAADFDEDGIVDLLVTDEGSGLGDPCDGADAFPLFLGLGDGTFEYSGTCLATTTGTDTVVRSAVGADFNGDGHQDVAVTRSGNLGANFVACFLGRGDATFEAPLYCSVGWPMDLSAADLDGDSHPDLLVTTYDGPRVLLGLGDGTFAPGGGLGIPGSLPLGLAVATFGRLDGDEHIDAVATEYYGNVLYTFHGRGDGAFDLGVPYAVGGDPRDILVEDIDRDGHPDIVTANQASGSVTILRGRGDGTFLGAQGYPAGAQPTELVAADWNEDGSLDLAATDRNWGDTGLAAILLQLSTPAGAQDGPLPFATLVRVAPNPFRGSTEIRAAAPLEVEIFDPVGRLVRRLKGASDLLWDGADEGGRVSPPGVYLYRARTRDGAVTGRLTLLP